MAQKIGGTFVVLSERPKFGFYHLHQVLLPITPTLGEIALSSGLCMHPQSQAQTHTHLMLENSLRR